MIYIESAVVLLQERAFCTLVVSLCGRYWTRTSDPRRVKAVLYQLSQSPRKGTTNVTRRRQQRLRLSRTSYFLVVVFFLVGGFFFVDF
jgi:hypothetical protein